MSHLSSTGKGISITLFPKTFTPSKLTFLETFVKCSQEKTQQERRLLRIPLSGILQLQLMRL